MLLPSRVNPIEKTNFDLLNSATCFGVGWYVCGSLPAGARLSTITRSPPIFLTQSPTMLVDTKTGKSSFLSALSSTATAALESTIDSGEGDTSSSVLQPTLT